MKNSNTIIITLLLVILVGGGSFFAGVKYQQNKGRQFGNFQGRIGGQGGNNSNGGNRMMGFRPVTGQIVSSDNNSITVKMNDGSSRIVLISQNTSINKAATASATDLKVGDTVAVFGQTNSDGSVTAQNIQLNPKLYGTQGNNNQNQPQQQPTQQ